MEMTRLGYMDLLGEGLQNAEELSQGQMLLLGLNGLFDKAESNLLKLVGSLKDMPIPDNKLAALGESRDKMQAEFSQLDGVLLAQRLVHMTSLFQNCALWAKCFQSGNASPDVSYNSLIESFERMARSWKSQFLPDVTKFCLGLLCARLGLAEVEASKGAAWDDVLALARNSVGKSSDSVVDQACELITTVEEQWRKWEHLRLLHQRQEIDRGLVQLFQQQLAAHAWIHDTNAALNSSTGLFLLNLRQSLTVLLSQSSMMSDLHQQMTSLTGQVEQRLKWAAGANPNLRQVMKDFTDAQSECLQQLQESSALATSLAGMSSAVLHYESFRTRTPEALAADTAYIQVPNGPISAA